jgi:type IV pilus assembly protein PilF
MRSGVRDGGSRPRPGRPARVSTALVVSAALIAGCGGTARPAGDPSRMSESEYDIARDLWLRQGKLREALDHALEATELDEDNAEASHLVALLYLDFCSKSADECRLPDAERAARRALATKSDFREARNTLGVVLIHQKRHGEAIATLEPLTRDILYETPENAWGNLGWAQLEAGQLNAAIESLRRAIAAQPEFCVGHYRLGLAYEKKQQPAQALESFDAALGAESTRCRGLQAGYAARARVLVKLGRGADAAPDLERCITLSKATREGKECAEIRARLK